MITKKEAKRRSKLSEEKPLAYAKIMQYAARRERGESCAIVDFAFDYVCNLSCRHCLNTKIAKKDRKLTVADIAEIARQADEIGLAQFNISGGEPLVFKNIDEIIKACAPDRFHLSMSTNGMFLDVEKAKHLKAIGLDKIRISVDNINEEKARLQRNDDTQHKKALEALKIAKDAGLDAGIQHMVSHQTAQSQEFIELLEFATENDYMVDILPVRALGELEGRYEVLIDDVDSAYIKELHKKYPVLRWDMIPSYGSATRSCGAVSDMLHINKYGDVLPCVFIQISIGNIFEDSLQTIINKGFSIRHFSEFRDKCLSGEDRWFIKNYMSKCNGRGVPISHTEVFDKSDYVGGESV